MVSSVSPLVLKLGWGEKGEKERGEEEIKGTKSQRQRIQEVTGNFMPKC